MNLVAHLDNVYSVKVREGRRKAKGRMMMIKVSFKIEDI